MPESPRSTRSGQWVAGSEAGRLDIVAVLFDCDGVLVNSAASSRRSWKKWAETAGVSSLAVEEREQGRLVRDTIADVVHASMLESEVARFEEMELDDAFSVTAIPGAQELVRRLPRRRWAVVTSASRRLARARLRAAALPLPPVLVGAEDVRRGKPDPECYLLAASKLHVAIEHCLVVEDSPVGVASAKKAGARVLGLGDADNLLGVDFGPVPDFRHISIEGARGSLELHVGPELSDDSG